MSSDPCRTRVRVALERLQAGSKKSEKNGRSKPSDGIALAFDDPALFHESNPSIAWMQPRENMKARAALQRSAPLASWRTSEKPLWTLPLAMRRTWPSDGPATSAEWAPERRRHASLRGRADNVIPAPPGKEPATASLEPPSKAQGFFEPPEKSCAPPGVFFGTKLGRGAANALLPPIEKALYEMVRTSSRSTNKEGGLISNHKKGVVISNHKKGRGVISKHTKMGESSRGTKGGRVISKHTKGDGLF